MKQSSFKRVSLALTIAALMAGCSSGVKLDDVPVEDKGATSTVPGANSGGTSQSGVAPVDLTQSGREAGGPVGVARIIYFDFDSFTVKPEYQSVLEGHSRYLKASSARKVMLEGHTDERGGREYNLALGQKRAEAVRRSLSSLGVPDTQMEAVSLGKEKPKATGHDEAAWAENRRADITY